MSIFGGCKHSSGFVPVLFEKITPTVTTVKAMVCPMCRTQITTGIKLEPGPKALGAPPTDTMPTTPLTAV